MSGRGPGVWGTRAAISGGGPSWARIVVPITRGAGDGDLQAALGPSLVQMAVQRGVVPEPAVLVGQLFELAQVSLRKLGGDFSECRITEEDPTTKRSSLSRCAAVPRILPGTALAIVQGARGPGGVGDQDPSLGVRNEQRVAILPEPTASTGKPAKRTIPGQVPLEIAVKGMQPVANRGQFVCRAPLRRMHGSNHDWIITRHSMISSAL